MVKSRRGSNVARDLLDTHPVVPTFHYLVKTHKLPASNSHLQLSASRIKARPIMSSCGGPSDTLSWLLVQLFSTLLQFVGAHVVDVEAFLASLSGCEVENTAAYAASLWYTNLRFTPMSTTVVRSKLLFPFSNNSEA